MPHTYSNLLIHCVWSTKYRKPLIIPNIRTRLFGYLKKSIEDSNAKLIFINGMPDHVHLLIDLPLNLLIPDLLEKIKPASTRWVHKNFSNSGDFAWQEGYGAFSVGRANQQQVINYIANQEEHHKTMTFEEEFIKFLEIQGISYDKRFLFR